MTRRGFSLVELMIVVAIIGLLSAIAIPNYQNMVLRAKRSEAVPNLRGIGDAEQAYFVSYDTWIEADGNPSSSLYALDQLPHPFDGTMTGWTDLGWEPDGEVRCRYYAYIFGGGEWARTDAWCDIDNDNQSAVIRYYIPRVDEPGSFTDVYPDRF